MQNIIESVATQRVILRAPSLAYREMLHSAVEESIEDLKLWLKWAQKVPSLDECAETINQSIDAFTSKKELQFDIFTKERNFFIGCAGLQRIDWSVPKAEIGYWIRTSCQGQGYATEVSKAVAEVAFTKLEMNRVEIRCDYHNLRSKSVAKKAGFVLEGVLRNDSLTPNGILRDTAVFSRIKNEYI